MKIAFTLCSNNYIPQARLLIDSFLQFNPDYLFVLGLVDEKSADLDYSFNDKLTVVSCSEVLPEKILIQWKKQYKIVELNTAPKPFYFQYLFEKYPKAGHIIFFDPDIYVYNTFDYVEHCLQENDIILTPHTCTPVPLDGKKPSDRAYLKYGIFNLGFIAVKRSANAEEFLHWLSERLKNYCYMEVNLGMYVDQLWINHVSVYFNNVFVSKHMGLNCAYWNLHERYFSLSNDNTYVVNKTDLLLFFHFSALDLNDINSISKSQNRYSLQQRDDLRDLVNDYSKKLVAARADGRYDIPCVYTKRNLFQKFQYYKKRLSVRKNMNI